MKVLLPSLINERLINFPPETSWNERYKSYERAGIDRNPFVKHLHKHGIEYRQYWINYEAAQKDWAREHKVEYRNPSWFLDILAAQIKEYQPDVIYNTTLTVIPYSFIQEMKSSLEKNCLWICYYGIRRSGEFKDFKEYDTYFTGFHKFVEELSEQRQKHFFFPHYFDEGIISDLPTEGQKDIRFSFVGSLNFEHDSSYFSKRRKLVEWLMEDSELQVWSHLPDDLQDNKQARLTRLQSLRYETYHLLDWAPSPIHLLSRLPGLKQVKNWMVRPRPEEFFHPRLHHRINPPKYGRAMYETLSRSELSLNIHGQVDINSGSTPFVAGNIRLFEATGSGTCLLTDNLPHLDEFFEPEKEIVTFDSPSDAVEKARYLMDHPKEREEISRRGNQRAWKDHTSSIRAKQFAEFLQKHA